MTYSQYVIFTGNVYSVLRVTTNKSPTDAGFLRPVPPSICERLKSQTCTDVKFQIKLFS